MTILHRREIFKTFRKKFSNLSRLVASIKQGGQVSILFAFLMPIFILFLGVALDLGWYYLNVSRLQNAADAAAVAGAQTLINSENFSDYKNVVLISKYPGKVSNKYRANDVYELTTIENSKTAAEDYAGKNLSGEEGVLVNSWTKNEVETEGPTLYAQDDNLYFVVQLKDTIKHFFLPGWFDDMTAPVTSVAMMSKTAVAVPANTSSSSDSSEPTKPSTPDMPIMDLLPDMPFLPDNPLVISEELKNTLNLSKNKNVIVGNWEVQNTYKNKKSTSTADSQYKKIFGTEVYSERWNHFQDFYNHYATGSFYRTGTVTILDDVETDEDGNITSYGVKSSVAATTASINNDENSIAYNPAQPKGTRKTYKDGITESGEVGLPYTADRLDSINIDFRTEVSFQEDPKSKWLEEDWDLSQGFDGVTKFNNNKGWDGKNESIRRLRIHSSINFDGVYTARDNDDRQEENKNSAYDILWARIESEPMLYNPDLISDEVKANYKSQKSVAGLNSVNQIIINANASNTASNARPYVIFYDGPETNDVYSSYASRDDVLHRKSLPVILNLNVPFNAILYAPNSPVVIIGNAKDNFKGFVVAKKYMRLKDDDDFDFVDYTDIKDLSIYGARTYKDKATGKTCYKITDENGIEMFVDKEHGDIQFADLPAPPTRYGTYDNFDRTDFSTEGYKVLQSSADNMLLSGE